jgi:hypothetical protein
MTFELISGVWSGYYEQGGDRYEQQMTLEFADGLIRGDGIDGLGEFTLEGEYRVDGSDVRVGWVKTYNGAHSVLYLGAARGAALAGKWKLPGTSGGFALQAVRRMGGGEIE